MVDDSEDETLELDWPRLIRDFMPQGLRLAVRLCGDLASAEDALQEALLRIAQAKHQFKQESEAATWMTRIVINSCRDWRTRQHRSASRTISLDQWISLQGEINDRTSNGAGDRLPVQCDPRHQQEMRNQNGRNQDGRNQDLPQQNLHNQDLHQRIRAAIDSLPARQRQVMQLLVWQQQSVSEIAEHLQITTQNVYATVSAARKRLKIVLADRL